MYSRDIEFEKVQLPWEIVFIELSKWPVSDQLFHFLRPLLQCPSPYSKAETYQGLLPQLAGKQAIGEIYLTTVTKFSDKGVGRALRLVQAHGRSRCISKFNYGTQSKSQDDH